VKEDHNHVTLPGGYRMTFTCRDAFARVRDGIAVHYVQRVTLQRRGFLTADGTPDAAVLAAFNSVYPPLERKA
jgi:hypothetical protein